ncbi:MAG: DUF2304 domain-containing protein [Desulfofustis sp.]|nr:DUF2304 domain-containing protein [Desulfofustis sp.]
MIEKIHLYQVVVVAISSVMLFQGIKEFVKRESGQTILKLLVRLIVWGGMAVIAIYPNISYKFSKIVGIEDNITAVIVTGFVFVFLIIFKLLSAIEKLEQNVSELTRRDSLREAHERIEQLRQDIVSEDRSRQDRS